MNLQFDYGNAFISETCPKRLPLMSSGGCPIIFSLWRDKNYHYWGLNSCKFEVHPQKEYTRPHVKWKRVDLMAVDRIVVAAEHEIKWEVASIYRFRSNEGQADNFVSPHVAFQCGSFLTHPNNKKQRQTCLKLGRPHKIYPNPIRH